MEDGLTRNPDPGAPPGGLAPVWILAEGAPPGGGFAPPRAAGRTAPVRRAPPPELPFGAAALLRLEPDIGLMSCFRPTPETDLPVASPVLPGGAVLLRPHGGAVRARVGGTHVLVEDGEAILLAGPASLRVADAGRLDALALPARAVTPAMAEVAASLRVFPRDSAALALLHHYGAALMRGLLPVATGALREHALGHMAGLVVILCADPAPGPVPAPLDRAAARIGAIKAEIELRLDDRTITARRVAQQHGISLRSLQKLFEAEGRTFSDFVLERRLDRALRLLRSPARRRQPISAIAFEVGFGDLSYFNRTFRRRYGIAPRRARAAPGDPPEGH
ncbi:transcriptional regulator, AraC family [Methylobacterium sp. 4-46]|uniref:helix-turn-helix transcriptional regulator n=1 Tax=unclassified Methylobacterium TaxID=2615210 RepID=UPI000152DED5|nr:MULTISPECIES: helix-turn-helix transcriptional regulator [Methylobacterium]ACA19393.1 transcriptional regulator, AraC family [Methylobacterium sp. 4-46]WFT78592.1 helix-turn-helix transcriptional regulator [Methylobacterium nodulans]